MAPSSQRVVATGVVREGDVQLSRGRTGRKCGGRSGEKSSAASGARSTVWSASLLSPSSEPAYSAHCSVMQESNRTHGVESNAGLPEGRKWRPRRASSHHIATGTGAWFFPPIAVPISSPPFWVILSLTESYRDPSALPAPSSSRLCV